MRISGARMAAIAMPVVLAAALAGCGSSSGGEASAGSGGTSTASSGDAAAPLSVLAIVDTTGATKAFGSQELVGLKAAAAYYDSKGGIDGHKVEVESASDNGEPATAASVATKSLTENSGKYSMVYAGEEGTTVAALVPVMAKFPVYSVALDDPGDVCASASKCPNEFANLGSGAAAEATAAEWFKAKGYTKIGFLEDKTAYTETETPALQEALKKEGVSYSKASFPATAVNLSSEMSQLKADNVEAVFAEALGPAAGYVLKARAGLGWKVPVVFDVAGSALDLTTLVPEAQTHEAFTTVCPCQNPAKSTEGLTELKKFAEPGAIEALPVNLAGNGWDAMVLFATALEAAKSTSAAALTKATEELSPSAQSNPLFIVTKEKKFTSSNHQNEAEYPSDYEILAAGPVKGGQTQPEAGQ